MCNRFPTPVHTVIIHAGKAFHATPTAVLLFWREFNNGDIMSRSLLTPKVILIWNSLTQHFASALTFWAETNRMPIVTVFIIVCVLISPIDYKLSAIYHGFFSDSSPAYCSDLLACLPLPPYPLSLLATFILCTCVCVRACVHACARVVCMRACVRVCVGARACVYMYVRVRVWCAMNLYNDYVIIIFAVLINL